MEAVLERLKRLREADAAAVPAAVSEEKAAGDAEDAVGLSDEVKEPDGKKAKRLAEAG